MMAEREKMERKQADRNCACALKLDYILMCSLIRLAATKSLLIVLHQISDWIWL